MVILLEGTSEFDLEEQALGLQLMFPNQRFHIAYPTQKNFFIDFIRRININIILISNVTKHDSIKNFDLTKIDSYGFVEIGSLYSFIIAYRAFIVAIKFHRRNTKKKKIVFTCGKSNDDVIFEITEFLVQSKEEYGFEEHLITL